MSEQDLHADPPPGEVVDPEAVVDELDGPEVLGTEVPVGLEAPEADAVEQRATVETDPEDDYPPA